MAFWFYMCLSTVGHIRVATLWNHMKQNNDFTKCFLPENHIAEWERLTPLKRFLRLVLYLALLMCISCHVCIVGLSELEGRTLRRRDCRQYCERAHFPSLKCRDVQDMVVTSQGNLYDILFQFEYPGNKSMIARKMEYQQCAYYAFHPEVGHIYNEERAEMSAVCFTRCRRSNEIPTDYRDDRVNIAHCPKAQSQAEYDAQFDLDYLKRAHEVGTTVSLSGLDTYNGLKGVVEAEDKMSGLWRVELDIDGRDVIVRAENLVHLVEKNSHNVSKGDNVELVHLDVYNGLRGVIVAEEKEDEFWRIELNNGNHVSAHNDNMAPIYFPCVVPENPASEENKCEIFYTAGLWCVGESTPTDNVHIFAGRICVGGNDAIPMHASDLPRWCISAAQIAVVIFVGNVLHFFISMLLLGAASIFEDDDFVSSAQKFACELSITVIFMMTFILMIGPFQMAARLEKHESILVTWMFALVIDQVKSIFVQPIIWWVIIRRCGTVEPGIQEYNEEYLLQWDLQESLMMTIRRNTQALLQWRPMAIFMTHFLIGSFTLFVLLQLAFKFPAPAEEHPDPLVVAVCKYVTLTFIILFIIEIVVKTFAYGIAFLLDPWNLFDSIIIGGTMAVWLSGDEFWTISGPLGILRVVRLLRMMMVVRRVSEGRKKLKRIKKSTTGYDVGSHVDTVLELVDELQLQSNIPQYLKEDLEWFTEIIVGNKLYKVSLEENNSKNGKEVSAWMAVISEAAANPQQQPAMSTGKSVKASSVSSSMTGRMRGPGATLVGSHVRATNVRSSSVVRRRASEVGGRGQGDEATQLNMQLYSRSNLSQGEEGQIESTLKPMDEWSFDLLMVAEVLDVNLIPIVFLKFVILYEFVPALNIDFDLLFNYCTRVQENALEQVKFHSPGHTTNMIQACHFFLMHGLDHHLTHIEKFTLFFACLVANESHAGVTNDFLVNVRHPRAIRYNDRAVLQNYNLSHTFNSLQDPELNFFIHVDKDKYDSFRKLLISIILKLEFRKHFDELSIFKTKLASDFPLADSEEDKTVLMAISLRMADISWSCRPLQSYLRWSEKFFEELFMQGDLEKQMGLTVSPFCEKDIVNTSKCQLGYLMVIVQPLALSYAVFLNDSVVQKQVIEEGMEANRAYLRSWVG